MATKWGCGAKLETQAAEVGHSLPRVIIVPRVPQQVTLQLGLGVLAQTAAIQEWTQTFALLANADLPGPVVPADRSIGHEIAVLFPRNYPGRGSMERWILGTVKLKLIYCPECKLNEDRLTARSRVIHSMSTPRRLISSLRLVRHPS